MQTVAASVILEDAQRMMGWNPAELDTAETAMSRNALSMALQELWEVWWWETLMVSTQTQFAKTMSNTLPTGGAWTPGLMVYWPQTDKYYLNLFTVDGIGQHTPNPTDASGTTQFQWWMEAYQKDCAPTAWDAAAAYSAGAQVTYQTVYFSALEDQVAGSAPDLTDSTGANTGWAAFQTFVPTTPYVDYLGAQEGIYGKIRYVADRDPYRTPNARQFRFTESADGYEVWNLCVSRPWVFYRRVTPIVTADPFDPAQVYDATPVSELVFDN